MIISSIWKNIKCSKPPTSNKSRHQEKKTYHMSWQLSLLLSSHHCHFHTCISWWFVIHPPKFPLALESQLDIAIKTTSKNHHFGGPSGPRAPAAPHLLELLELRCHRCHRCLQIQLQDGAWRGNNHGFSMARLGSTIDYRWLYMYYYGSYKAYIYISMTIYLEV